MRMTNELQIQHQPNKIFEQLHPPKPDSKKKKKNTINLYKYTLIILFLLKRIFFKYYVLVCLKVGTVPVVNNK